MAPKSPSPSMFTALDELSRVIPADLAKDFLDHRKLLRKPMTPKAGKLMASKLEEYAPGDREKMVEQSILKGWTDVYPLKPEAQHVTTYSHSSGRPTAGDMFDRYAEILDGHAGQGNAEQGAGQAVPRLPYRPH